MKPFSETPNIESIAGVCDVFFSFYQIIFSLNFTQKNENKDNRK